MSLPKPDPWRWIEADSRAIEIVTALFVAVAGFSCWLGGWFGNWMPSLRAISGYEPSVTGVSSLLSMLQIYAVFTDSRELRWFCSMSVSAMLAAAGAVLFVEYGFRVPGGPLFLLGAIVQLWACLSVASDMRRHD